MTGEVVLDHVLGRGRHATVWSAHIDGLAVACKRWDDPRGAGPARERAVRACVTHPNLLGLVPTTGDDLILPLGRESLAVAAKDIPLDDTDLRRLAAQMAAALGALHDAGWIHGDVAPTNILALGKDWVLADLDQAGPTDDPPRGVGTRGYAAPEVLAGGAGSVAADIHALAATLLAAAHGQDNLPPSLARWVRRATDLDPAARPALTALLEPAKTAEQTGTAITQVVQAPDPHTPDPASERPRHVEVAPPRTPTRVYDPLVTTEDFLPVRATAVVGRQRRGRRAAVLAPGAIALLGLALTLATTSGTGRQVALLVQAVPAVPWLVASLLPAGASPSSITARLERWWSELREASDPGGRDAWPPARTSDPVSVRPSPLT